MGWMNVIYKLSGGDFLTRANVLLQPINETFSWLTYENRKDYDEAETSRRINR